MVNLCSSFFCVYVSLYKSVFGNCVFLFCLFLWIFGYVYHVRSIILIYCVVALCKMRLDLLFFVV